MKILKTGVFFIHSHHIGGVMESVLASSVVKLWVRAPIGSNQTIKLVFVASPLCMYHQGERSKTGWLRIGIMCPSGVTCLSTDCCFSELAL